LPKVLSASPTTWQERNQALAAGGSDVSDDEDEIVDFEEMVPEYQELASFFEEMASLHRGLEIDRDHYQRDPKCFDVVKYRESGDLASYFDQIEGLSHDVGYYADGAWELVS